MARAFAELEADAVRRGVIAGPFVSSAGAGSPIAASSVRIVRRQPPVSECGERRGRSPRARARARVSGEAPMARGSALGRGVGAAGRARAWRHARGQGGHRARAHARRRGHRWTQLRAQAPVARSRVAGSPRPSARTMTLAISDVHGPVADDPSVIGSGPTVGDPTTFAQALAIVRRVDEVPSAVRRYLERGARGELAETVKPDDVRVCRVAPTRSSVVARPRSTARRRPHGRLATPST